MCINFSVSNSSQIPLSKFQLHLAQRILKWRGIQFLKNEGSSYLSREGNFQLLKISWHFRKIFFINTIYPEKMKLVWKHSRVMGLIFVEIMVPWDRVGHNKYRKIFEKSFLKIWHKRKGVQYITIRYVKKQNEWFRSFVNNFYLPNKADLISHAFCCSGEWWDPWASCEYDCSVLNNIFNSWNI